MLRIIYITLTFFYGILSIVAVNAKMNKRRETIMETSNLTMFAGSFLIILSNLRWVFHSLAYLFVLVIGLMFIHIGAILNEYQLYGKVNLNHHIVRAGVSFMLFCLYILTIIFKK